MRWQFCFFVFWFFIYDFFDFLFFIIEILSRCVIFSRCTTATKEWKQDKHRCSSSSFSAVFFGLYCLVLSCLASSVVSFPFSPQHPKWRQNQIWVPTQTQKQTQNASALDCIFTWFLICFVAYFTSLWCNDPLEQRIPSPCLHLTREG